MPINEAGIMVLCKASGLVKIYGNLVARYRNAICFVQDDIKTNKYYYDLPTDRLEQVAVEDGF